MSAFSFQLANNRGRYSHFVHLNGDVASLHPLETLHEARAGIMCEKEFPKEAQYNVIEKFAGLAVGVDPHVIVTFDEGTSPFPARYPANHPANLLLIEQ